MSPFTILPDDPPAAQSNDGDDYLVDIHIHAIGNGSSGSGCTLNLRHWYHRLLSRHILKGLGLPYAALSGDLDRLYADRIVSLIAQSSLDYGVVLAHEHTRAENGAVIKNFGSMYVPNDYVISLATAHEQVLAGVSIHPARPDALDELERCLEAGAVLMKCLPNVQNIDCSDRRFIPFWERMAKAKLPLLAHTGGELALPVFNAEFADPQYLSLPLECGVTVIAAHCGSASHPWCTDYTATFLAMLERYPNLYGDISGMQTPYRSKYLARLLDPAVQRRLVHGSDFPIPVSSRWARMRGLIDRKSALSTQYIRNELERDLQIKAAMGFELDVFSRAARLLRAS